MAKDNLAGGFFYPHGKPGIYAYTKHFVKDFGGDTGYLAYDNTKYPGLGGFDHGVIIKALWNLESLITGARTAELAFIKDTGIDINNPNNSKDIFKTINTIFNSRGTFERGIRYLRNLSETKGKDTSKTYREVSRFFTYYLDKSIKEQMDRVGAKKIAQMTEEEIEKLINNIITQALHYSYERVSDIVKENGEIRLKNGANAKIDTDAGEQEVTAITDMLDAIDKLSESGAFSKFGYLFNLDRSSLLKRKNQAKVELKKDTYTEAEVSSKFHDYGGNALELITSTVAGQLVQGILNASNSDLQITAAHTGQWNEMKADTILFVGKGKVNVNNYLDYIDPQSFDGSVRAQNVDALQRYLNDLEENVQHVIAISDKNYSITSDFGGIEAQGKMKLQYVGTMLQQFGVDHVPELITYLANCGPAMIQGQMADAVRTELQSFIGYFMFDNLQVEINGTKPKVNVVNLMNVSGIYIPLSVFLEGVYNSIQDAAAHPSSLVRVTVTLDGPTEQNVWTEKTWHDFRDDHETQSFLSYKILKGIADFITGLV